jgi:hypothetical protein
MQGGGWHKPTVVACLVFVLRLAQRNSNVRRTSSSSSAMIILMEVYHLCHSITPTRDSLAFAGAAHVAGPTNASLRHTPLSAAKAPIVDLGIHCY